MDEEDLNNNTSDDECVVVEKKRKYTGAFQYKTSFRSEWRKIWPFIAPVPGSAHEFRCQVSTICVVDTKVPQILGITCPHKDTSL